MLESDHHMGDNRGKKTRMENVLESEQFREDGPFKHLRTTKVSAQVPGIANDRGGVHEFVEHFVIQIIFDVLELQGRSALLPDTLISPTLSQLSVNIACEPLECQTVAIYSMGEVEEDS
ncbi:hypothetical protein KIN20_015094 [Parelaphostrongylus tenuis]|uniref:Uncharacterized protein n=1 Tax=Parelaphostrongylus tenuis TaxID=148309 RepID=A0AAD5MWT4_PARTN|nr:hypothetical protein KIN20_015094 [Parelaphostrongylus tenuis]